MTSGAASVRPTSAAPHPAGRSSTAVPVNQPAGAHRLYLVYRAVPGGPTSGLSNLNWVEFTEG
ncbi:hypothetical protein [Micromonospora sp. NBC_00617]|uniref:hypothetical protein n=1 Tax=Micromonospora sp. NBC_00617 TaxID=2903587 RepID=UPI0030E4E436